jgi:putative aldouronate transport system substrate-binding protein
MKKIGSIVLTSLLGLSLLISACSKNTNTSTNADKGANTPDNAATTDNQGSTDEAAAPSKDPITFSYFLADPDDNVPEHTKIGDMITKETGVTIKYERLVGELEQKLGVMIASGDYPDLIYGQNKMYKLVDAKALIPLEDLIDKYAPNIKRIYEPYWERIKDPKDGHIYAIPYGAPTGTPNKNVNAAFWIQKTVLKDMGFPKIKTIDEYFAVLKEYAAKHPQMNGAPTIPFDILTYDWRNFTLTSAAQFLAGGPNDSRAMVDPSTFQLNMYQIDENIQKKYYGKLNEMNKAGLIDQEAFVMNYDQYLAKISSGNVLGMFDQFWQFQQASDALKKQGKRENMYVPLPITFDESIKDDYLDVPSMNYGFGFGISVDAKDPIRAIQFADYMASDEMQKLRYWGIKDEDYMVNEEGRFYRTDEQRKNFADKAFKLQHNGNVMYYYPSSTGTMPDGNSYDPMFQPEEIAAEYDDLDKEILKNYGVQTYPDLFSPAKLERKYFPLWSIDISEKAKIFDQKMTDINKKWPARMVLAKTPEEFEKNWTDYVKEVNKLDVKGWVDELTTKVKDRQDKW